VRVSEVVDLRDSRTETATNPPIAQEATISTIPTPQPSPTTLSDENYGEIISTQFLNTHATNPEKSKERTESAGIVLFGSRPRDPIFEFTEEGSTGKENERVSKDVQKLTFDMTTEAESKELSEDKNNKDKEKSDKTKHYKTRKEPQISDPIEAENLINITDDTEIFDLTKKAAGGKKKEKGGLVTTWKEIRTAAGALPQQIRTIIVPLHKAYNIPEKYMRGLLGKKFAASKNKKSKISLKKGRGPRRGPKDKEIKEERSKQNPRRRRKKMKKPEEEIGFATRSRDIVSGRIPSLPPVQKKFRQPEPIKKVWRNEESRTSRSATLPFGARLKPRSASRHLSGQSI